MNIIHDFHDIYSLDCLMPTTYIFYQAVGRADRTQQKMAARTKEMRMSAHGHTLHWGTHIGVGRASDRKSWYQQMKDWWAAHKAARQAAKLATLRAQWDAGREAVRPLHADAAVDMVASTHACSTTTALCDLSV
jgi:hypothetical protein